MTDTITALVYLAGFLIVFAMLFAAIRELVCKYFKINDRLRVANEILEELKILNAGIRARKQKKVTTTKAKEVKTGE